MGMHGVFRLPDELLGMPLKNHVCHPLEDEEKQEWDFKIGPATLMVAPGTVNEKGKLHALDPLDETARP